jgi:hypothetical protein
MVNYCNFRWIYFSLSVRGVCTLGFVKYCFKIMYFDVFVCPPFCMSMATNLGFVNLKMQKPEIYSSIT